MREKNDKILKGVQIVPERRLQGIDITLTHPHPREYSIYLWVRRCGPAPQTLTVLKTKNVRFVIPC